MTRYLLILFTYTICLSSFSQNHPKDYFRSPLDIPLILSGTFGELRSNHFHAGIDLKTKGQSGLNVYAIADGYVSRIKVSPWGYGKAIYITHYNGYTSVYAHLMRYTGAIQDYVIDQQYLQKSYDIELFPDSLELKVQKGQIIGLSGNTGSSAAPHLHFEIRNSQNQYPQNGLQFGFDIKDDIPPIIKELKLYRQSKKTQINGNNHDIILETKGENGLYMLDQNIEVSGPFSIGLNTYDLLNFASNKNGVFSIDVFVDSSLIYSHKMEEFGFHETTYINCHMDYKEKTQNKRKLHKCFRSPNNKLSIYDYIVNEGIINTVDSSLLIEIFVKDVYGNTSNLKFNVNVVEPIAQLSSDTLKKYIAIFPYNQENEFVTDHLELLIPTFSLYDTIFFEYQMEVDSTDRFFSPIHHIHDNSVTTHYPYTLSFKTTIDDTLFSKCFIAKLNDKKQVSYVGGKYENGRISTKTKVFGSFTVSADTLKPEIKGLNIYPGKLMKSSTLKINVKDDLSGIYKYSASIDGKWILMEYEPKNNRLTHYFKSDLAPGKHLFKIRVEDAHQNISEYQADFYR